MKLFTYILSFTLLATSLSSAQTVQKVTIGDNLNYGITYSLPKTCVNLRVKASCKKIKAGEFAPYAEKFLAISDAPQEDMEIWTLEGMTMETEAVPDSTRTFHVLCPEKAFLPSFYLSEKGSLWAINCEPSNSPVTIEQTNQEQVESGTIKLDPRSVLSEEILRAGSKAKQAELAARQICRIRESRMDLLTGEEDNLPADEGSYKFVLANLDAQEQAYLSLFVGETTTTTLEETFVYVPQQETDGVVLFRFSQRYGFVDVDDLSGDPYSVAVSILEDNRNVPAPITPVTKSKINNGIAYTVPGKAEVSISSIAELLCKGTYTMGQFGHVEYLPSSQFTNKKKPFSALFNPATGAILKLSASDQQ